MARQLAGPRHAEAMAPPDRAMLQLSKIVDRLPKGPE